MAFRYKTVPSGREQMGENTYCLMDEGSGLCCAIDPDENVDLVLSQVADWQGKLTFVLLTHGHFDHFGHVDDLREAGACPLYIHRADAPLLAEPTLNLSAFFDGPQTARAAEGFFDHGQTVVLGSTGIEVLHTPGHTKGSCCFFVEGVLFSGDTLMAQGYGRTDFPGGDMEEMLASLRRLTELPGDTIVLGGHGGEGNIDQAARMLRGLL